MQLQQPFTATSLKEALSHSRRWYYWPLQILGSFRALLYLGAGIFVGGQFIVRSLRSTPVNLHDLGLGVLILFAIAGLLYWIMWRTARNKRKALSQLSGSTIALNVQGIATRASNGASTFAPWISFQSFKWGSSLVVLRTTEKKA